MHAHHFSYLVHTVTAGIDHDITINIAFVRFHRPGIVLVLAQRRHGSVAIHLRTMCASTSGQSLA